MNSEVLFQFGQSRREILWEGDWTRLIFPMFLHGGLIHIAFNFMSLKSIGPYLELRFGASNFMSLYLLSGIWSFCVSQLLGANEAVGASGSIMGLLGADLAIRIVEAPVLKNVWRNSEVRSRVGFIAFFVAIGFFASWMGGAGMFSNMDNWAHLGGAVAGCIFGVLFESWSRRGRLNMAAVAIPIVLTAALIVTARWTIYSPYYHVHQGLQAREEKRNAEAEKHFEEALRWGAVWGKQKRVNLVIDALKSGVVDLDGVRRYGYKRLDAYAKTLE
jgi:membrane associated rhomboid family serine protease